MSGARRREKPLSALGLLRFHRLPADVAAAEAVGPVDAVDGLIGAALRFRHGLAERADIEHAAAIGEDRTVLGDGAGMEDLDGVDLRRLIEPVDARALLIVAG